MISIVIPVYNRAQLVKRTLASVAAQTLRPDALILVDNNSTDDTLDVLCRWATDKPWVTVITETKPGAAAARNAGLALVKTPYVMFFDSDDVMPPRHVEQVTAGLQAANLPQIGAFSVASTGIDGKRKIFRFRKGDPMFWHIFSSILATQRYAVSTDYIRQCGAWNESMRGWDDWELGMRLLKQSPTLSHIHLDQLIEIYLQAESITGIDFSSKRGEWEQALDACSATLEGTRYAHFIDYRRAILAGNYVREGHPEYATNLTRGWRMRFVKWYVSHGGRGVAYLARILR